MQGTVVAVHSGGLYRVQCDAGHEVLAQLSGRMRRFRIKVVPGDRVTVGVSPYDPSAASLPSVRDRPRAGARYWFDCPYRIIVDVRAAAGRRRAAGGRDRQPAPPTSNPPRAATSRRPSIRRRSRSTGCRSTSGC